MPVFVFKGYSIQGGALKKGRIEAESLKIARARIKQKEKIIISEIKVEASADKLKKGKKSLGSGKVKLIELAVMTKQFATLQSANVPLDESLKALSAQVENITLRNTLSQVKDLVSEGRSLAEAAVMYPAVFNKFYVNMIKAGETSGALDLVLNRLSDFMDYQVKVRGQIASALAYPVLMIGASSLIIVYLFVSVVPKLQKVFESLKVKLPWYTKGVIQISEILQNQWYIILGVLFLIYFLFKKWSGTKKGRRKLDQFILTTPVFGPLVLRMNVSKFTRTLSTLLESGVPIIRALEITRNIVENVIISEVVDKAKTAVQEGESLGLVIERSKVFPALVSHMIRTGEKTGQLEEMLGHVAKAYDREVEQKVEGMISLIEPLMIIVLAGMIVVIVMALLVPMLSVMNQQR